MNGPKVWNPLLDAVASVYGSAVVAGGSPRDYAVNKRFRQRDIDVFVTVEDELELELGVHKLLWPFERINLIEPDRFSVYIADEIRSSNCAGVLEGRYDGQQINVIGKTYDVNDTDRLFADFDHSLCRFAYDGERTTVDPDAQKTLDSGSIIVYNSSKRTKQRLERLMGRRGYAERFKVDWTLFPVEEKTRARSIYDDYVANFGRVMNAMPARPAQWEIIR